MGFKEGSESPFLKQQAYKKNLNMVAYLNTLPILKLFNILSDLKAESNIAAPLCLHLHFVNKEKNAVSKTKEQNEKYVKI